MLLNQSTNKCRCNKSSHKNLLCTLCGEVVCIRVASFCHCPRIMCPSCVCDIDYCDGCKDFT